MSVRSAPTLAKYFLCTMLSQTYLGNIDWTIFLCNVVPVWSIQHCIGYFLPKGCLLAIGHHYTGKNFAQCCPRGSRQQCTGRNPVRCGLNTLETTLHRSKFYAMLSLRLQATMHGKNILLNNVLILLEQHCTGKTFVQCCSRGSKQHCTGKSSVQCCLNTLGTKLHR